MVATFGHSVFNFFNQTLRHQTRRKEFYSSLMHSCEQLFSVVIDETNIRQINQYRHFIGWARLPAFIQFVDTAPGQLAFEKKPRRR